MSWTFRRKINKIVDRVRSSCHFEELEVRTTPAVTTDGALFSALGAHVNKDSLVQRQKDLNFSVPNTMEVSGDYYMYQGDALQLKRYVDRIVVSLDPATASATKAALTAPGGVLQYFEPAAKGSFRNEIVFVAKAGTPATNYTDFSYLQTRLAALKAVAGVEWSAPVFHYISSSSNAQVFAGDEINVALKPGVNPVTYFGNVSYFSSYSRIQGTTNEYTVTVSPEWAGTGVLQLSQWMASDPSLIWASPNLRQMVQQLSVPNDTLFGDQWGLHNVGQLGGISFYDADADLPEAWDTTTGSSTIVIGMSDTGFETAHPDLAGNLWVNPGEIAGNGIDDDANGWIDDVNGWDFASGDNDPNPDGSGTVNVHGTATAGIAGAVGNNAQGISGTSQQVKLMGIRMFDAAESTTDAIIEASVYYTSGRTADGAGTWQSADIQSASWGGGAPSAAVTGAYTWGNDNGRVRGGTARGTIFAQAAGNGGSVLYPANLSPTLSGMIAVGAANELLDYMGASSGPELDVLGFWGSITGITTTDRTGAGNGYDGASDYTNTFGGTSAATPHVAGIASLVLSTAGNYNMTNATMKTLLRDSADKTSVYGYTAGFNTLMGYGVANAKTAVDRALGNTSGRAEVQSLYDDGLGNLYVLEDNLGGLDFGQTILGTPVAATIRVYNWGSATLSVANPTAPAGFSVTAVSSTSVAPGDFATFTISLTSPTPGVFSGNVVFTNGDNDTTGVEDERTYEIPVTGVVVVPSISGTVFHDWNGDAALTAVTDPTFANHLVYLDQNNNSTFDSTTVSNSSAPNLAFGAAPTSVSDIIAVAAVPTVFDVNVTLNITHTWDADVVVTLTSPTGTVVTLVNQVGGSGVNFTNTVLDDEAITPIASGAAPFTGSFKPSSPLSNFDGEVGTGNWTLTVTDVFPASDNGVLVSWTLDIVDTSEANVLTDANGAYYFGSLPNGSYRARTATPSGYGYTTPDNYVVTITGPLDVNPNKNFGLAKQNAIYGNVYEDWNNNAANNPADGRLAGWTTWLDTNNNGAIDAAPVDFFDAPGTAIADVATTTTTQVVAGVGNISDLNVKLNITHTWDSDLQIKLQSPGGTTVNLVLNRGGSGDNFTDTVLDDEAATAISAGTAPFTGSFKPEQALSTFDGSNADGTWTLIVIDQAGGDTGTIVDWTLTFPVGEASVASDAVGNYTFTGLTAGPYNVREVLQAGFTQSAPGGGVYSFALAANATAFGKDFGNYRQQAVYGNVFNDLDASGAQNGAEPGLAGWTVFDDQNNNGVVDVSNVDFFSAPGTFVPDNVTTTTTQNVVGVGVITDVNIKINITHTWDSDLQIKLLSPGGTTIDLVLNRGGSGDNFTDTVLDDEAATAIGLGAAPFTGSFKPEQALSTFDGSNADGTWTLIVIDQAAGDTGTIVDWTLTFPVGEANTLSDATGNYILQGMAVGAHRIKEILQPTWTRTAPVSGEYLVNITAGNSSFNNVFGNTQAPVDTTAPTVTGLFIDGSAWTTAFRTAAGNATFGYPAQTGAGQLTTMPWSTVNRFIVTFSEPVTALTVGQIGVRGVNVASYVVSSVTALSTTQYQVTMAGAFDTDWLILDVDGSAATGVKDIAGNALAGTFTENVSTFPTTGAAGVNFKYRFKVAVGDADRNAIVRNADVNLVRSNLFVDAGSGGYNLYADIDGNGLVRNADVNATRAHLFVDAPTGGGPSRPRGGAAGGNGTTSNSGRVGRFTNGTSVGSDRTGSVARRLGSNLAVNAIDELFAQI